MRYALLLLPFVLAGCAYPYPANYGYGYGYGYPASPPAYAPDYGQYSPNPAMNPNYAYNGAAYPAQAGNTENCGTPYEFRACPPLPRHPLPYYPANRS